MNSQTSSNPALRFIPPTPACRAEASANAGRGKIARLPARIRRELNLRLENNQPADAILPWLNSLPETQQILAAQFNNTPITPQNLSEWRQGGFREWLLLQELMDHAARLHEGVADLPALEPAALADDLATALAARYAALLNTWDGEITPEFEAKINFLRGLSHDIVRLQKSLHRAAQDNRDLARQKKQDAAEDLEAAKDAAIDRLKANSRLEFLQRFNGAEVAHHRVAIETAASESEVAGILNRFISESIQVNPTKMAASLPTAPTTGQAAAA